MPPPHLQLQMTASIAVARKRLWTREAGGPYGARVQGRPALKKLVTNRMQRLTVPMLSSEVLRQSSPASASAACAPAQAASRSPRRPAATNRRHPLVVVTPLSVIVALNAVTSSESLP
jgi:hypothetical protein